jgi:hypothetical protein
MDVNNTFRNTNSVIKIDIPRFERVIDPTGKEYTVYKVVIAKAGGTKEIIKRYSEFNNLHSRLNKTDQLPRNIEFPPKTLFTSSSASTKEERRRKLKRFLQELCDLNPIPEQVLAFLGISQPIQSNLMNSRIHDNYSSSEDLLDSSTQYTHQPLLAFTTDPYLSEPTSEDDILLTGILDGIYNGHYIDVG